MKIEKEKHFEILRVGAELDKRFLQKTMNGVLWTSGNFSHKFASLAEAEAEASKHESVAIIWVDGIFWGNA